MEIVIVVNGGIAVVAAISTILSIVLLLSLTE